MKRFSFLSLGILTAGLLLSTVASAAQAPGGQRGGDWNPADMRERVAERMQQMLGASDAEFKVIRPLLEDVQDKQRASMAGRMGGMGMMAAGRGGQAGRPGADQRRPGAAERATTPVGTAAADLSSALESESTPASEIRAKLQALRDARSKADDELKASQNRLRDVLTARQEAQLVVMGLLQ
jgi:hypothetical protein